MRLPATLAVGLLLGIALAGCSGGGGGSSEPLPPEWRGRDLRKPGWANVTVQPGWTVGVEYTWSTGTKVAWDWLVFEPVYVHFQLVRMDAQGGPRPLVANDAQEGQGERTLTEGGVHQVDWMDEWNKPVTIAYKVPAGGQVKTYPPGQGPGCLYSPGRSDACLAPHLPGPPRP